MNFKNKIAAVGVALISSIMTLQMANASEMAVVYSSHGAVVIDSNGNCVRTMWVHGSDVCAKEVDIMKMDERIVYFDFDKFDLKDSEKMKLDMLASALEKGSVKDVKILGFTDKIGNPAYNKTLSEKRAIAVKEYLDKKVKLDNSPIDLRGMGESQSVAKCDGIRGDKAIECLAPERRVEVVVDYLETIR